MTLGLRSFEKSRKRSKLLSAKSETGTQWKKSLVSNNPSITPSPIFRG